MAIATRPTLICAWCERLLVRGNHQVSHGICQGCIQAYMPEVYDELARERGWE